MRKSTVLQIVLLLALACFCLSLFLLVRYVLELPFRSANDALHRRQAPLNLDFLVPGGTYLDEKITIGEVIKMRFRKETPIYEKAFKTLSDLVPVQYRYLADLFLFLFWSFSFMTFFRVFTFMRYGRALRGSLLLGGCTYYFMPDFSPGTKDDILFMGLPFFIISFHIFLVRSKKKKKALST